MVEYAAGRLSIREVNVNGLNPQDAGFYRHTGFETYKRTALNESCDPYPLLFMRLR